MRKYSYLVVCFLVLVCGLAAAQGGFRPKVRMFSEIYTDQRRVIGTWCKLDFDGARLAKDGWTKFSNLTMLKSNPEFVSFYVISRYEIEKPESATNSITVTYYELGEFRPESGFIPGNQIDRVQFETAEHEGELVIRELSEPQPRVSRQAAILWLKQQTDAAKTTSDRFNLEQALKALTTPAPPPSAK